MLTDSVDLDYMGSKSTPVENSAIEEQQKIWKMTHERLSKEVEEFVRKGKVMTSHCKFIFEKLSDHNDS